MGGTTGGSGEAVGLGGEAGDARFLAGVPERVEQLFLSQGPKTWPVSGITAYGLLRMSRICRIPRWGLGAV